MIKFLKVKKYFDLSNFPKNSKYYCADNKKVPGKRKDEQGGKAIYEFASPKPKLYTIIDENYREKIVKKEHNFNIRSDECKDVINNEEVVRHSTKEITSKNHKIYTKDSNKISLFCFDDKRYTKDDGIDILRTI